MRVEVCNDACSRDQPEREWLVVVLVVVVVVHQPSHGLGITLEHAGLLPFLLLV